MHIVRYSVEEAGVLEARGKFQSWSSQVDTRKYWVCKSIARFQPGRHFFRSISQIEAKHVPTCPWGGTLLCDHCLFPHLGLDLRLNLRTDSGRNGCFWKCLSDFLRRHWLDIVTVWRKSPSLFIIISASNIWLKSKMESETSVSENAKMSGRSREI